MLKYLYWNGELFRAHIVCFEGFREGREDLKIYPRIVQLPPARNSETVTKRHKLVAGYRRMTIKLTEDQLQINLQTILRIILHDLEKRGVGARLCTTVFHGWVKGAHSHKLWIIYQTLSDKPTLSQLYRYWRRALGVWVRFQNKGQNMDWRKSPLRPIRFSCNRRVSTGCSSLSWYTQCNTQRICVWRKNSETWILRSRASKFIGNNSENKPTNFQGN